MPGPAETLLAAWGVQGLCKRFHFQYIRGQARAGRSFIPSPACFPYERLLRMALLPLQEFPFFRVLQRRIEIRSHIWLRMENALAHAT